MARAAVLPARTAILLSLWTQAVSPSAAAQELFEGRFESTERVWIGPEFWANRLQDWRLANGRAECVGTRLPMRTLHLLTHRVGQQGSELEVSVRTGLIEGDPSLLGPRAVSGILIGAGAPGLDHRAASLVQSGPGPDGGYLVGVDGHGRLIVRNFALSAGEDADISSETGSEIGAEHLRDVVVRARLERSGGYSVKLTASAHDPATGRELARVVREGVNLFALVGNLALICNPARGELRGRFWYRQWRASGDRLEHHPARRFGPIAGAQHTLSDGTLKLTAQLFPIAADAPRLVRLETRGGGGVWSERARATIVTPGYTASLRVDGWDARRDTPYRVVYRDDAGAHLLEGVLGRDPRAKNPLVLAALSCNHNNRHGFGNQGYPWNANALWFPHGETVRNVALHAPDLLFFAGDQIYEGASPTPPDRSQPYLDYLYKWLLWYWAFGELAESTPCITVPDDHDVYQGNLWGAGGRSTPRDNQGGYVMPAEWVKMVERTQTSHLPDPWSAELIEQGLSTYYTSMVYGRIGFAILEDRKFKSGPSGLVEHGGPRPDHVTDPDFDPRRADVPGATLLGARQLELLEQWAADWRGVDLKLALSQTSFAGVATHHGGRQDYLVADLDSNGWPQSGRNRALAALRKGFAFMVAGDQHLASLVHHGIDEWDDAGWSFVVPAIANFYSRSWRPPSPPIEALAGRPAYSGRFFDGLGNRVSVWAVTNPRPTGRYPARLHDEMPGYGIVRLDKEKLTITAECWPRGVDPRAGEQYEGWPVTIDQRDNYAREPRAYLPTIEVVGVERPVLQVVSEATGEVLYTRRAQSTRIERPGVFAEGMYEVTVGEPGTRRMRTLKGVATGQEADVVLRVKL